MSKPRKKNPKRHRLLGWVIGRTADPDEKQDSSSILEGLLKSGHVRKKISKPASRLKKSKPTIFDTSKFSDDDELALEAIREADNTKVFNVEGVEFINRAKAEAAKIFGFNDYESVKDHILKNFHNGVPAYEAAAIFRVLMSHSSGIVAFNYMLRFDDNFNCTIWVLEVGYSIELSDSSDAAIKDSPLVKRALEKLVDTGVATSVKEIISFAIKALSGGSA